MPKRIYVSNSPATATPSEIQNLFAPYGKVANATIEGNGRNRVAYVGMVSDTEAAAAISDLHNAKMGTATLNVNEGRPRTD